MSKMIFKYTNASVTQDFATNQYPTTTKQMLPPIPVGSHSNISKQND